MRRECRTRDAHAWVVLWLKDTSKRHQSTRHSGSQTTKEEGWIMNVDHCVWLCPLLVFFRYNNTVRWIQCGQWAVETSVLAFDWRVDTMHWCQGTQSLSKSDTITWRLLVQEFMWWLSIWPKASSHPSRWFPDYVGSSKRRIWLLRQAKRGAWRSHG